MTKHSRCSACGATLTEFVIETAEKTKHRPTKAFCRHCYVTHFASREEIQELARLEAEAAGYDFLSSLPEPKDDPAIHISRTEALKDTVFPLGHESDRDSPLWIAIPDPSNLFLMRRLALKFHSQITFVVAPRAEIQSAISKHYPVVSDL